MNSSNLIILRYYTVEFIFKNGVIKELSVGLTLDKLGEYANKFKHDPNLILALVMKEITDGLHTLNVDVSASIYNDHAIMVGGSLIDGREVVCMTISDIANSDDVRSCLADHQLYVLP